MISAYHPGGQDDGIIRQDDGQDDGRMARMMARMIAKKQDDGQDESRKFARARDPGPR